MHIVYIDAQNVHKGLQSYHKWVLDRSKFFVFCRDLFQADAIKIFFGYIEKHKSLYKSLEQQGYIVCFKETLLLPDGTIKGNVDIDIAIIGLKDYYESHIHKAYLVTGDGDYNSLVDFWKEKGVFGSVLVPGIHSSSKLLRRAAGKKIIDIAPMHKKLQKEKPSITT